MKIKKIAELCAKRKMINVYEVGSEQWIGNGRAIYPLHGLPLLEKDEIFTMFDIPHDQREKYTYTETKNTERVCNVSFEDCIRGEQEIDPQDLQITGYWDDVKAFRSSIGIVFIDRELLKPFDESFSFYERMTANGVPYIAVKRGMILLGIIYIQDILTPELLGKMESFVAGCRLAMKNLSPKDIEDTVQLEFNT